MKIIRTVLGDIPADQIGATDAHDHLIRSGGPEIKLDPAFLMDDVETAKKEFGRFLDAGGRTMVCMDPIGCGRNVSKMLEVAKAYEGKGNIVMTTGFQKGGNYCPNTSFLATVDTNIVAKYMIAEVAEGMDLNSYNGPYVERTIAKAGVIKAGTSYRIITKLEQKALAVAAITQKETGCPISMHTDFGTMGSEILDEIEKNGGKSEKTVLCHMQETQIDIITALFWTEEQPSVSMNRIKRLTVRTQRLRKISAGCWIGGMRTRSFLAWMPEEWKDLLPIENRLEEPMVWSIFSHGLFHC